MQFKRGIIYEKERKRETKKKEGEKEVCADVLILLYAKP